MTVHKSAPVVIRTTFAHSPIPIRSSDWYAVFDDYDGAPDSGYQCFGEGYSEIEAVIALYYDWESLHEHNETLCAHRPMFEEDLYGSVISSR